MDNTIQAFTKGVHNLLKSHLIPADAASDAKNWYTKDGRIVLVPGKYRIGAEGAAGAVYGQIFGYKVDGSKVHWRKIGTKIQYLNGSTWTDVVTGLTDVAEYTFSNYSSLAGIFTFAFGPDGIYKFHNANPASHIALYDSAVNFKGFGFIDRGRTILWGRTQDKTGLYGSKIDRQNSSVYTSVTGEATTSLSGTLAFKAAGPKRNCFAVAITITASGQVFSDNFDGTLTGSLGGTGTINYITGAYTLSAAGVGTAAYQYEDSNAGGVTDFTKSSPRQAAEGFQFPQDEGGDAIKVVLIGPDGAYYSMKEQSVYRLEIDPDDTNATNEVFRRDIGIATMRGAVSTSKGIVLIDVAKAEGPKLTVLQRNPLGDNVEPIEFFPHFDFSLFNFDDASLATWDSYILIACRTADASANDSVLLADLAQGTVDITAYHARTFAQDAGVLFCGSSVSQTIYQLYSGYDDDGFEIANYWISKAETFKSNRLKRYRKQRFSGRIDPDQYAEIYIDYDDAGFQLVGTIRGDGTYVDNTTPQEIGAQEIGESQVGGTVSATVFPFQVELKLKVPKFQKRRIKIVAKDVGYLDFDGLEDHDLFFFEKKLPKRYRVKQNVSLDGQSTDEASPSF